MCNPSVCFASHVLSQNDGTQLSCFSRILIRPPGKHMNQCSLFMVWYVFSLRRKKYNYAVDFCRIVFYWNTMHLYCWFDNSLAIRLKFWSLLKETMGFFDGARTHNLHITSQTCNPLWHAAPSTMKTHFFVNNMYIGNDLGKYGTWSNLQTIVLGFFTTELKWITCSIKTKQIYDPSWARVFDL